MKGYESETFTVAYVLEDLSRRGGCDNPAHGALTMWADEAEHIVQALADSGLFR